MMLSLGLDFVAVGDFQSFRCVGAADFIESFLKIDLDCIGVACGFNHRFGHRGLGTPQLLSQAFGIEAVELLPEVTYNDCTVSSSAIRTLISQGDVETACEMLGRAFALRAPVVCGKRLGRQLGFPTANQYFPASCVIPAHGIYATRCFTEEGDCYVGISNVGVRPTITDGSDDHRPNCETYLHGFSGDLYDKNLTVEFCKYLRGEQKFASVNDLKSQIEKDLRAALEYFGEA
jgi:riboflavin kinase/FMN adenylyltransferase